MEWINVKDKLPPDGFEVIGHVLLPNGGWEIAIVEMYYGAFRYAEPGLNTEFEDQYEEIPNVTHWGILPPPKNI